MPKNTKKNTDYPIYLPTPKREMSSPKVTKPCRYGATCKKPDCTFLHEVAADEVAAPKVAAPKVAAPKVAAPKVAVPKVAAFKVATPKVAAPKVAAPKAAASNASGFTDEELLELERELAKRETEGCESDGEPDEELDDELDPLVEVIVGENSVWIPMSAVAGFLKSMALPLVAYIRTRRSNA